MSLSVARLLRGQVVLEEHDPLPDGTGAVVVRRFVHAETYRSHLQLVDFGHARSPRALTTGPVRDTTPRVSPDGRRLAFEVSEQYPANWKESMPVVLEALQETQI